MLRNRSRVFNRHFRRTSCLALALMAVLVWAVLSSYSEKRAAASSLLVATNPVPVVVVSAANFEATSIAPNSQVSAFGTMLATTTAAGSDTDPITPGIQLPTELAGTKVEVNGVKQALLGVSPTQVNFVVSNSTAVGTANIVITSGNGTVSQGTFQVRLIAPAVFTINGDGQGPPNAVLQRVKSDGTQSFESPYQLNTVTGRYITKPIDLGDVGERVFLLLFLSGVSHAPDTDGNPGNGVAENLRLLVGGTILTPAFAGPQGAPGFDQMNVELPRSLTGSGLANCAVTGEGFASNTFQLEFANAPTFFHPTISNFSPTSVLAGQTLTITGSDFSNKASEDEVRIGGKLADVISASPIELQVTVPFGAQSGLISVKTPKGEGVSGSNLIVRTSISGFVQNTSSEPLANMTARLVGTTQTGLSNSDGSFIMPDVSGGVALVEIDGSTIPASPPYPSVVLKQVVTNGRDNSFSQPIYLQQASGPSIGVGTSGGEGRPSDDAEETDTVISGPHASATELAARTAQKTSAILSSGGVTLEIQPGTQARFPNGDTAGLLTLTQVSNSLTPVNMPPGVFSGLVAEITPFGVTLTPGATLTFLNVDGLPAGSKATLFTLDQDPQSPTLGTFISLGQVMVSADGKTIMSPPGAITRTSIFFVAVERPTTTITGRVVDCSGNPLAGATVSARGQSAITDDTGAFVLRYVPVNGAAELITVQVSLKLNGKTFTTSRSNVFIAPGDVTRISPDFILYTTDCGIKAFSQGVMTSRNTSASITLRAIDNGGNSAGLKYIIVRQPSHGAVRSIGFTPRVTYTPALNFCGVDQFVFKAVNSLGVESNLAIVTVTVKCNESLPSNPGFN